jgi:DNA-binding transcriptional regulator YiaG
VTGRDLKRERAALGFSQEEMAEWLSVSVTMLVGWEQEQFPPPKLLGDASKMLKQPRLF